MDHDGVFICARDSEQLPPESTAANLQRGFEIAGVHLGPPVKSLAIRQAVGAAEDVTVLAVSNRDSGR
jgi:hypothetical protein